MDSDGNGLITFNEFLIGMLQLQSNEIDDLLRMIFRIFDIDKNGIIDKNELVNVIEAVYDLVDVPNEERIDDNEPNNKADEILNKLSKKDKEKINEQEFIEKSLDDEFIRNFVTLLV